MPHNPSQIFWKYPRNFWSLFGTLKAGHCARRSLRRPWKLGLRIVAWSKPRMFCKESLGKIKFGAFPKRVGPRILSLERVDYFGTSEHFWVGRKKIRIIISKIAMIGCGKLSLYANGSCDEHAIGDDWNDVPCKSLFLYLAMMLFLWNWGSWIFVYLYTQIACYCRGISGRTKSIQKQIKSIEVDKVGSKKPLASKLCFL